jgi:hypothetical protein
MWNVPLQKEKENRKSPAKGLSFVFPRRRFQKDGRGRADLRKEE